MYKCPTCGRYSLEYNSRLRTARCLYVLDCSYSQDVANRKDYASRFQDGHRRPLGVGAVRAVGASVRNVANILTRRR